MLDRSSHVSNGVQKEDKNLLQHSQLCQHGEWACECQWTTVITPVWSESLWDLRKSCTGDKLRRERSCEQCRPTALHKRLYLHHRREFQHQIVRWGQRSRRCSQNHCAPFLSLERINLRGTIFSPTRSVISAVSYQCFSSSDVAKRGSLQILWCLLIQCTALWDGNPTNAIPWCASSPGT